MSCIAETKRRNWIGGFKQEMLRKKINQGRKLPWNSLAYFNAGKIIRRILVCSFQKIIKHCSVFIYQKNAEAEAKDATTFFPEILDMTKKLVIEKYRAKLKQK